MSAIRLLDLTHFVALSPTKQFFNGLLEVVLDLIKKEINLDELRSSLAQVRRRIETAREQVQKTGDLKAADALARIDGDEKIGRIEYAVSAAKMDIESANMANDLLRQVHAAIDKVEDALEWPTLVSEAQEELENTRRILNENEGSDDENLTLRTLESELSGAIDSGAPDILRQKTEKISGLGGQVLTRQPEFWVGYLQYLEASKSSMRDSQMADQLIRQGSRAMNENDIDGLRSVVAQLVGLLPAEDQEAARGYGGTTQTQ